MPDTADSADYLEALGVAVRRLRTRRGLSQEDLSAAAGLDRTYVSGIERGVRNPTVASLLKLCEVLGTTPAKLLRAAEKIEL